MVELLVVKNGKHYCRFHGESFEFCTMKKASVFTISDLETVKGCLDMVRITEQEAEIMKLTIMEELFREDKE